MRSTNVRHHPVDDDAKPSSSPAEKQNDFAGFTPIDIDHVVTPQLSFDTDDTAPDRRKRRRLGKEGRRVLGDSLRRLRRLCSGTLRTTPLRIFRDSSVRLMVGHLPSTERQLSACCGVGAKTVEYFGSQILQIIQLHLDQYESDDEVYEDRCMTDGEVRGEGDNDAVLEKVVTTKYLKVLTDGKVRKGGEGDDTAVVENVKATTIGDIVKVGDDIVVLEKEVTVEEIINEKFERAVTNDEIISL